ncbi:MAG: glycosyltransferase family 2 protein [Elusimicrobiota bacterium]
MTDNKKILIIIPSYNEEESIANIIREIRSYHKDTDILIIDDGSVDNTVKEAEKTGCIILRHAFNLGDGAARHTGYLYANKKGYDFVVQIDADEQHNPSYICKLLQPLFDNMSDIVIGSRFYEHTNYETTFSKKIGMFIFNTIASLVTRMKITDSTSGFRAVNKKAINFFAGDIYPSNFPDADLIILSHFAGFRIKEIPVEMRINQKKIPLHHGIQSVYYVFKMLLSISVTLLRERPKGGNNL